MPYVVAGGEPITCCNAEGTAELPKNKQHPACMPILIPSNDPVYGPHKIACIEMVRTALGLDANCELTSGQQVRRNKERNTDNPDGS
jgi:hypothetical protein